MILECLIVDDNEVLRIRETMQRRISEEQIKFYTAEDGAIAVEMFKENPYDIVILDYHMPKMNGDEAAKKIREMSSDVTLIGFSLEWDENNAKECDLAYYHHNIMKIRDYLPKLIEERDAE